MNPYVGTAASLIIGLGGPILVWWNARRSSTTDAAQKQIDQVQEDRAADREEFGKAAARFNERQSRLEIRIEQLEQQILIYSDYALQLRYHISEGNPPPPPPFPPSLTRGMTGDR